jgi:hypothetical protein
LVGQDSGGRATEQGKGSEKRRIWQFGSIEFGMGAILTGNLIFWHYFSDKYTRGALLKKSIYFQIFFDMWHGEKTLLNHLLSMSHQDCRYTQILTNFRQTS